MLYLAALGLSEARIGLLLSLTLLGDVAISVLITSFSDKLGRRRMLVLGAGLMVCATMVWTHVPSNLLLILVPLMPTLPLAILVLLVRFSISQMDAPTRQSYTMAVVDPDERSAADGITRIARTLGSVRYIR